MPTRPIKESYKILCCSNNQCEIKYKQRDRNSAQNMMNCLDAILAVLPRPPYLCVQKKSIVAAPMTDQQKGDKNKKLKVANTK